MAVQRVDTDIYIFTPGSVYVARWNMFQYNASRVGVNVKAHVIIIEQWVCG